jgi:pyruvate-ferredoxin/flavodoxin oxidoreductase
MQTCFFALCGVIPKEQATERIKAFIQKAYGGRGEIVVQKNYAAVDQALAQADGSGRGARLRAELHG